MKNLFLSLGLALLGLPLIAQEQPLQPIRKAPTPAAPTTQPGVANPFIPGAKPANAVNAAPIFDPSKILAEGLEEPMMDGNAIAFHYRKYTNNRVIVSKAAQAVQISFIQPGPLTYAEAGKLLEKAILLEGLVFVPSGPNEVKLVLATNGRKVGGVPLITNEFELPRSEELVTYVMTFSHIKADDALQVFNGVISQLTPKGSIASVANANALIITENSSLIKTLIKIGKRIDVPQEVATKSMVTLEHADAEEVATKVQEIMDFSAEQNTRIAGSGSANTPIQNLIQQAQNNPTSNGGNAQNNRNNNNNNRNNARTTSTVKLVPELRTNRIMIMGRPIDVEFATTLIKDFDAPNSARTYFRQRLSFLAVSDFLPIAQDAIELATTKTAETANGAGGNTGNNRSNNNNNRQQTTQGGNGDTSLAESDRSETPESLLVGKTLIVADNANNSIIIQGPPQSISVVQDLIKEMDIPTEQVQITAMFGRYNVGDQVNFGIDFARFNQSNGGDSSFAVENRGGFPILVDPTTLNGVTDFDTLTGGIAGLSIYGRIGKHFAPTLRALEATGKFSLLGRPSVFTTNNKKAVLSSGQSIAVPTNSIQGAGVGGGVTQSTNISYRDVLLKLEVIPLVNSKDEVTLQISFINENIVGSNIIDGNTIPTIGQEELLTTVTVPNGETIILGGLITERDEDNVNGVPILSKIPGLKRLFSSTDKNTTREELVIFIQPRIVDSTNSLMKLQDIERRNSELVRKIQDEERARRLNGEPQTTTTNPKGGYQPSKKTSTPLDSRYRGRRR